MGKIYKGQPYTLRIDTGQTLTGGSDPVVRCRAPSGTTTDVMADVSGTELVAAILGSVNAEAGAWKFQGLYTFSGDAAPTYSDVHTETIYEPLSAP